jgi:hypothetical protein
MKVIKGVAVLIGLLGMFMISCHNHDHNNAHRSSRSGKETGAKPHAAHEPADTTEPVVIYSQNLDDQVTDNDFIVKVYPTLQDDQFRLVIRYGANRATDEVSTLPPQYYTSIQLRKGASPGQCILGFVDKKGVFNEMTLITASSTRIGIRKLKAYYLSNQ